MNIISVLVFVMACSSEEKQQNQNIEKLEFAYDWKSLNFREKGPFQVGHQQFEHTYQPLPDQEPRTIVIEVWYPTEDTEGEMAEYFVGVDALSFSNAVPAAPIHEEGYPVHISSHGYRGWGANSAFLMRHFASHGWVVIAPNHTDNTIADHASPLPLNHFIHRPMDITESLDLLETEVELAGKINTAEVVLSGHSFGASYSTWASAGASYDNVQAVCEEGVGLEDSEYRCTDSEYAALSSSELHDPRVVVSIPMAGSDRKAFFGDTGYQSAHAPILFVSGTNDNQESNQNHFDDVTGIDFRWLSLEGACHQSFTTGGCPTIDTDLGFNILNAYLLGFSRQRLLEDDSSEIAELLDGSLSLWNEATLLVKE